MKKRGYAASNAPSKQTQVKRRTLADRTYAQIFYADKQQAALAIRRQKGNLPASFNPSGTEIKAVDVPPADYGFLLVGTGSSFTLLNGVQTGTAFFNRIGSRIEMKNLHIRGNIRLNATTAQEAVLRLIIVYDRQPTGSLPNITDLLQSRDQDGNVDNNGASEINLDLRDRFSILRDMQWYAPSGTTSSGVVTNQDFPSTDTLPWQINEFIKLKGLGVHFKSSSQPTTISDISTGALYATFTTTGTNNAFFATVGFRMRYEDK